MRLERYFISILMLLLLLGCTDNEAHENLQNELQELRIQNDSLMEVVLENEKNQMASKAPQWYYPETDARELLDSGIENPEEYIKNALLEKTDLIPMDAVLGGTMRFNNIQLLGDQWLIADFEDGHVYGKAILEYNFDKNNTVAFRIIAQSEN